MQNETNETNTLNQVRRVLKEERAAVVVLRLDAELFTLCDRAVQFIASTPRTDYAPVWAAIYAAFEALIAAEVGGEKLNASRVEFFNNLKSLKP